MKENYPLFLHTIQAFPKGAIRSIHFDNIKNYIVASNYDDGVIALIDAQKPGKEKYAHNVANLTGKTKVQSEFCRSYNILKIRRVVWSSIRAEIYGGSEDGTIAFMDAKKAAPICKLKLSLFSDNIIDALKGHNDGITKFQLLDKDGILISGGKDKQIKVIID